MVPLAFARGLSPPPGKSDDPGVSRFTPPVLHGYLTTPLHGAHGTLSCRGRWRAVEPEKPECRRGQVERLDTDHGLVGMGEARPKCGKGSRGDDLTSQHGAGSGPTQPKETMMRFYDRQHRFYAGIDLHARTLHLCVLDAAGAVVCDVNLPTRPDAFLAAIAPSAPTSSSASSACSPGTVWP